MNEEAGPEDEQVHGDENPVVRPRLMRTMLLGLGFVSVAAGIVGIILPLVPTTPFLLLAAWCFARSSDRFYRLLMSNRWLGPYLRNYRDGRGMTRRAKASTLILLWLAILGTAGFVVPMLWSRLLLIGIATGVTLFLLRLPTCTERGSSGSASGRVESVGVDVGQINSGQINSGQINSGQ